jgi:hypothetical protein
MLLSFLFAVRVAHLRVGVTVVGMSAGTRRTSSEVCFSAAVGDKRTPNAPVPGGPIPDYTTQGAAIQSGSGPFACAASADVALCITTVHSQEASMSHKIATFAVAFTVLIALGAGASKAETASSEQTEMTLSEPEAASFEQKDFGKLGTQIQQTEGCRGSRKLRSNLKMAGANLRMVSRLLNATTRTVQRAVQGM